MSSKCFITFLNTTTQTERSGSNSRLQPPCLHASHSSFLRRKVANGMPEALYSFVPSNGEFKGVRTFSQLVKHVAVDNYMMGAALLGGKAPIDVGVHENGPDGIVTKAEIVEFLQHSFTYLHKAVATVNQRNLMESVSYEGVLIPRLVVVNAAISHPWDIFGQMIEYLRMNGIDPQKLP